MASLFDDLPSSDSEEDADYVPEDVSSDEEPIPIANSSDDEIETKKPRKSKASGKMSSDKNKPAPAAEVKTVDEKKKAEDIYKSFLSEVEAESKSKLSEDEDLLSSPITRSDGTPKSSGYAASGSSTASPSVSSDITEKNLSPPAKIPVKKESLEKIEENGSPPSIPEKKIETYDFAGETVTVSRNGLLTSSDATTEKSSLSSLESSSSSGSPSTQPVLKRKGGLESVLGLISKKKTKLSTLEKSKLDWNTFKEEEGIADELQRFNKGKGGYLERKRFLERSDIRSYEFERDLRLSKKKK